MTDRKRILVVDDETSLHFAIEHYFHACGYDVHGATDRDEATNRLASTRYDVVMIDVRLSGSETADGLNVIQLIRDRNLTPGVIVLTGNVTDEIRTEALRLEVDCVLEKPVPLKDLARIVADLTR